MAQIKCSTRLKMFFTENTLADFARVIRKEILKKGFEESIFVWIKICHNPCTMRSNCFSQKKTHKDAHHSLVFQAILIFGVKVKTYPSGASSYFPGDIVNFFFKFLVGPSFCIDASVQKFGFVARCQKLETRTVSSNSLIDGETTKRKEICEKR